MSDSPDGTARRSGRSRAADEGRDVDALAARLSAVERAVTDDGRPPSASRSHGSAGRRDDRGFDGRLSTAEESLADLDGRLDEVEAVTQALRGYVGAVRSVNREVERRADAALAAVDRIEAGRSDDVVGDVVAEVDLNGSDLAESDWDAGAVVDAGGDDGDDGCERDDGDDDEGDADGNDRDRWPIAERLRDAL